VAKKKEQEVGQEQGIG